MSSSFNPCNLPTPAGYTCTLEHGHSEKCNHVDNRCLITPPMPVLNDSVFDGFGSNWEWATVDYRGVARVHTFKPYFTPNGRIEVPHFKANSCPVPAFDIIDLPPNWQPLKMSRMDAPPYATDRFGVVLPVGADPMEAADVVMAEAVPMFAKGLDNPHYRIARSERCRCTITSEQLAYIVSRELNIDIDGDGPFSLYASDEGGGTVALTVEWERAIS